MTTGPLAVAIFGAPLDTGNRGVEALGRSVLSGIAAHAPGSAVTVFDNGWGVRSPGGVPEDLDVKLCGARYSRRYHRRESWANVRASQWLGGAGNPVASRLQSADVVLDVSGGDSFSDLYGLPRLRAVVQPKLAAARAARPLVLLPQTYGPFATARGAALARRALRGAAQAWSRDPYSHDVLLDLLADGAGVAREGVDLAFALTSDEPAGLLSADLNELLLAGSSQAPVVGVNVSGLLWHGQDRHEFGLITDYRLAVVGLVKALVALGAKVLLVPHVSDAPSGPENDSTASQAVRAAVGGDVQVVPDLSAAEAKWVISRLDWFCGSRMHATIAGLSSCVPTAGLAYSMKMRGVFATCDQGRSVVDAASSSTGETLERLIDHFERRVSTASELRATMPDVLERSKKQIGTMLAEVIGQGVAALSQESPA